MITRQQLRDRDITPHLDVAKKAEAGTLRGLFESGGQEYGAKWSGKLKMVFQSIAIPVVLFYVFILAFTERGHAAEIFFRILRDVAVWGTVVVTLWSGLEYIPRAPRPVSDTAQPPVA